jgi:hypothetical protein
MKCRPPGHGWRDFKAAGVRSEASLLEIWGGRRPSRRNHQWPGNLERFSHKRVSPRQPDESARRKSGPGFSRKSARSKEILEHLGVSTESPNALDKEAGRSGRESSRCLKKVGIRLHSPILKLEVGMGLGWSEDSDSVRELEQSPSSLLWEGSLNAFSAGDQASSRRTPVQRISGILRAAALVSLLFGALAWGLWAGMAWSADTGATDRGVMDFAY